MTKDELVERVARAIMKARFYDCEPDMYFSLDDFFLSVWPDHGDCAISEAEAALSAIHSGDRLQGGLVAVPVSMENWAENIEATQAGGATLRRIMQSDKTYLPVQTAIEVYDAIIEAMLDAAKGE